ncbi:hypothetical protein WH52_10235 [Tenacibaculum holothuriorum]|uniref:DUF2141 domain-containing protein n=1 Tax=Tenacibaculum holothuriorum TaxID=1635173 RepID=A0A1Y2PBF7_9FLAO|nr:DUF2141 domain-containing protein [Tenacibaculum holothuriorum]OSY87792.1 hypothetical protein WH52_10235 [Tenacibaculum holothuriorum]
MKLLINLTIIAILFIVGSISAQNNTITATVINASSDAGKVSYALYTKDTFMKKPLQAKNSKIKGGKSIVSFENVPEGEYAIICYHDKNDNDRMDFEPSGMPLEDYGASNNVMRFGPPQYNDAKFVVSDKDVSLEIKF